MHVRTRAPAPVCAEAKGCSRTKSWGLGIRGPHVEAAAWAACCSVWALLTLCIPSLSLSRSLVPYSAAPRPEPAHSYHPAHSHNHAHSPALLTKHLCLQHDLIPWPSRAPAWPPDRRDRRQRGGRGVGEAPTDAASRRTRMHTHTLLSYSQSHSHSHAPPPEPTRSCAHPQVYMRRDPLHIHTINGKTHQIHTCEHTPDNLGMSIQADGNANTQTYTHTMYTCMTDNQRKRCIPCTHPHIEKYQA